MISKSYKYYEEEKMEFLHTTKENVLIVTPKIENLDARDSREFKEKIIELISDHKLQRVVIDLKEVKFIDSSGLGSFLAILKNLHSQGGELKLSEMNKPIRTIFELISMHKIFEIFNHTEEAVDSFKN
jgi:anti-anti-sigma factor